MAKKRFPRLGKLHDHPGARDPHLDMPRAADTGYGNAQDGRSPYPLPIAGPARYLMRIVIFLAAVTAALAALMVVEFDRLLSAFQNNPPLNGAIVAVFVIGVWFVTRQVQLLAVDVRWLNDLQHGVAGDRQPRLLGSMAAAINGQGRRFKLSTNTARAVLDGVASRQGESREIGRYLIGLLIFLGLLGTFWGLLATVNAVADVIGQLNPRTGDLSLLFGDLTAGLKAPLDGMGTAFSTSLFGLATSLLLGFVDLQAGQAHNRFYNDLEEWLNARVNDADALAALEVDGGQTHNVPAYISALLAKSAESLDDLRGTIADHHVTQQRAAQAVAALSGQLATLTDQMRVEQDVLMRLAENQVAVTPVLERLSALPDAAAGIDEATRGHIRNADTNLARLVDELIAGRDRLIGELRDEIRLVARTVAAAADSGGRRPDSATAHDRARQQVRDPVRQVR